MSELTMPIAPALDAGVETRLSDGELTDAANYLRELMRRDRAAAEDVDRVRTLVDERLASGVDGRSAREVLAEVSARLT